MTLEAGTSLGHYHIDRLLGVGGMGEVYRAEDTKLKRSVAIKVLPEHVASDGERMKRFEHEARVLASLNHPGIAAIYGLEDFGGKRFLVLELVEGEDLSERLKRGALPLEESSSIAIQIAEALSAAHDKGIVHRDLKPANVKLTPEGHVKLLDFGLAKALSGESDESSPSALSQSPTLTRGTADGVILGTAAYMSPEQARGKSVDKRADVWAFGVVLFEMLTGRPLFGGDTVSDVLAAVLRAEPDWSRLPRGTPSSIVRLLQRCLAKDRNERLRDIADARLELKDRADEPVITPSRRFLGLPLALVLGAALLSGVAAWMMKPASKAPSIATQQFAVPVPGESPLTPLLGSSVALSPDGTKLAFAAEDALYLRRLDELEFHKVERTEGASGPFFSPDGEWVAFFAEGKLKKISLETRSVLALCDAPEGRGGAWRDDGTIVFAPDTRSGIFSVSVSGGAAAELTRPDPERNEHSHRWPSLLPDGKHALMTVLNRQNKNGVERSAVALVSLDIGQWRYLAEPARDARYLDSGHIVFVRENVLLRAPFDPGRMEIAGVETPILPDLGFPPGTSLQVRWAASRSGTVVAYVPTGAGKLRLDFVELDGTRTEAAPETLPFRSVSFSPDGERAAVAVFLGDHIETWTLDTRRKLLSRLGSPGGNYPMWSPDGHRLALVEEITRLVVRQIDGESKPELWVTHDSNLMMGSWTPDGLSLLYTKRDRQNYDVCSKSVDGEEKVLLGEPFREISPRLAPGGRWLAYVSDENGRPEAFVRAFPSLGHKLQVSTAGAAQPIWSPDGRTLYYLSDDSVVAASLTPASGGGLLLSASKVLFRIPFAPTLGRIYDISPGGERFLFVVDRERTVPEIRIVLNGLSDPRAR